MSVMAYSKKSITEITEGLVNNDAVINEVKNLKHYNDRCSAWHESPEDYIGRMVWYMYVGNITAYNLQYKENQQIDFEEYDVYSYIRGKRQPWNVDFNETINKLGGLHYNVYTNDGNFFVAKEWLDSAQEFMKIEDEVLL